ncbi:MAG: hypothetical protein DWH91_01385 [Planctomycetota bacterium]|nr:MAG: hypothetical protein DWH91_01385 [Planctomycetota bacterium]
MLSGRGRTALSGSWGLLLGVILGCWPASGWSQESDTLSLQLVAGKKPANELQVQTVNPGTSVKKTRDEAFRVIPFEQIAPAQRQTAQAIATSASMYRRLPTIRCQIDHRAYRFFADHPDVAVSLWRAMGVSKLDMFQTGEYEYEADAKDGTVGVIQFLHRSQTGCVVQCDGMFKSPVLAKPIQSRALLHVTTHFELDEAGAQYVTHQADLFVSFPSQTVETVAKALTPVSNKITDRNFEEITLFLRMMQLAMTQQPGWIEQMAGKLDGIMAGRSDSLLQVTAQTYIDEKRRQGEITGEPLTLEAVKPPVTVTQ